MSHSVNWKDAYKIFLVETPFEDLLADLVEQYIDACKEESEYQKKSKWRYFACKGEILKRWNETTN
jgi:hypothetical protein